MGKQILNETQLANQLIIPLKQATQYIVDKIMEMNNEEISKIVYDSYNPSIYERSGDLLIAWKSEVKQDGSHTLYGTFEYDNSKIKATSIITHEAVPYLAEIVYNGLAGHIFGEGPWTKKRDAWKSLEKILGANKIRKLMAEGLSYAGLNFKSHGGAIRA